MPPVLLLSEPDVRVVKRRLWAGETQEAIAATLQLDQKTISRVKTGQSWREIRWPDGTKGALPRQRVLEINRLRKKLRSQLADNPVAKAAAAKRKARK